MTRVLVLDGASAAGAGFALLDVADGRTTVLADHRDRSLGAAVRLPAAVAAAAEEAGWAQDGPDLIVAIVGPGSFTGLRASLALAQGLAIGWGARLAGVTVGEALADSVRDNRDGSPVWCVSRARRDRVFIETIRPDGSVGEPHAFMLDQLPDPGPAVSLLCGDTAEEVEAVLRGRGIAARLGPSAPTMEQIALAALRQASASRPVQPLYVDPPEAKLPAAPAVR